MKLYKKVLLFIIVAILFYVFWKLIKKNITLSPKTETFSFFTTPDTQLDSLKNTTPVKVLTTNTKIYNLQLKEYYIKASYNTALTGRYINLDMVKYVISRGCRFLDFEIYLIDDKIYVGSSSDINAKTLDTENSVLVDKIFSTIISTAFTSATAPNNGDPLFINLRIKNKTEKTYKELAKTISYNFKAKLHKGIIKNTTKLANIMGKIIIVIDKTINPDYAAASKCNNEKKCVNLTNLVNLESGSEDLFMQKRGDMMAQYGIPIYTMNDNMTTTVKNMYLISPDSGSKAASNPEYISFIKKYSSQITPYRYYYNDAGLKEYEGFFDDNKSAFVSMANAIKYFDKNSEE